MGWDGDDERRLKESKSDGRMMNDIGRVEMGRDDNMTGG